MNAKGSQSIAETASQSAENMPGVAANSGEYQLTGTISPWTTFCEGMTDIEKGYSYYLRQYKRNYSKLLPSDTSANILVVSAGPGYFVMFLNNLGFNNVLGIDTDPARVKYAEDRELNVIVAHAFEFLAETQETFDAIVLEQEINHLTRQEFLDFLKIAKNKLSKGGTILLNATNYANPITSPDHMAHNLKHFSGWTGHSLRQAFKYADFENCECYPLDNYVLYENPLNYVAKAFTGVISLLLRITFRIYGKTESIFTKRMIAVGRL
jgi:2-polyprenyl-3-methyl-5-hydroxy-6-metoxy-1,4-benzoquinol methylase